MTNNTAMSEEQLLPCPFCGGEARWIGGYFYDQTSAGEHVFCTACGVKMPRYWPKRTVGAKGAWNTRALVLPKPADPLAEALNAAMHIGDAEKPLHDVLRAARKPQP